MKSAEIHELTPIPTPIGFDAGDMNLFRYCGNDPVDRTDPTGLSPLTMFGGGDWMRVGSPFTNGELEGKAKSYVAEIRSIVQQYVDRANKGSRNVHWSASFSNWLKSAENFKDARDIATTDWSTKSEAVMNANGTVASFNVDLQINISWNEKKSDYFGSALMVKPWGFNKTGEIAHSRDALTALSSSYGGVRSARDIANEYAASMVGQNISKDVAASRMDAGMLGWAGATMQQSRTDHDGPFKDHWY
jgi:hypothetical protein